MPSQDNLTAFPSRVRLPASFISVTQQLDTSNATGRMMMNILILSKKTAENVRMIFRKFLRRSTAESIAAYLNREGIERGPGKKKEPFRPRTQIPTIIHMFIS